MAERSEIRRSTERLLRGLGQNVSEVADSTVIVAVTGQSKNPEGRPVARYINAVVGADPRIRSVTVLRKIIHIRLRRRISPPIIIRLPKALREFTAAFDAECFPQLVTMRTGTSMSGSGDRCPRHRQSSVRIT
jgi:hypothetical protein